MRRSALVFMLGLALFVGLAHVLEAARPEEECAGAGSDGGCALELCCSCCVHPRVDPCHVALAPPTLFCAKATLARASRAVPLPDPREIPHVPKHVHS